VDVLGQHLSNGGTTTVVVVITIHMMAGGQVARSGHPTVLISMFDPRILKFSSPFPVRAVTQVLV
jgi:hypothetical protein